MKCLSDIHRRVSQNSSSDLEMVSCRPFMNSPPCRAVGYWALKDYWILLAVLIERVGKEEAAPTPALQNWGRGSTVSSTSEVRQVLPG